MRLYRSKKIQRHQMGVALWLCLGGLLIICPPLAAQLQLPIPDQALTALASDHFPIQMELDATPYTLSDPLIENLATGQTLVDVQIAQGSLTLGRLVLSAYIQYEPSGKVLQLAAIKTEQMIPSENLSQSGELARHRINNWLQGRHQSAEFPLPDHPLVRNEWAELASVNASKGALILTFK